MINVIFEGRSVGQNRSYSCKPMSASRTQSAGQNKRPHSEEPISFSEEDLESVIKPHEDLLIIGADIGDDCRVGKIMIDNGSVMDILYYNTFVKMGLKREHLQLTKEPVYDFTNTAAPVAGIINLRFSLGERKGRISRMTEFVVVEIESAFNTIIKRPSLHAFKIVPSTYHQCLRYPVNEITATVYGKQVEFRISYRKSTQLAKPSNMLVDAKEEEEPEKLQPVDSVEELTLKKGSV